MRAEEVVLDLGEGANDLDFLLSKAEHGARGEIHRRVLRMIPGLREKLRLLEAIDQTADIRPVKRTGAHGAGLAGRDKRAGPEKLRRIGSCRASGEFRLGVTHGI